MLIINEKSKALSRLCKLIVLFQTDWYILNRHKNERGQRSGIDTTSTTTDPGYQWKSNELTIRHHKREP